MCCFGIVSFFWPLFFAVHVKGSLSRREDVPDGERCAGQHGAREACEGLHLEGDEAMRGPFFVVLFVVWRLD